MDSNDESPLINWQKDYTTWPHRMAIIKQKENFSDFKFIVGPDRTIFPANKLILAISSPEFEQLFSLMGSDTKEIILPNNSPEIFEQFLDFVYNGKIEITLENIGELLKLSRRYVMTLLTDKCKDFLVVNQITVKKDNVFRVLEISDDLTPAMKSICLKIIGRYSWELFQSEEFVKISKESLTKIVEYEMLPCRELVLFEAVNKWSAFACTNNQLQVSLENKRNLLGDLVHKIRFGTMSIEEFKLCSIDGNTILSSDEIFKMFNGTFSNPPCFYKKRLIHAREELPIKRCLRFDREPNNFCSLGGYSEFNITVDKHIYLCGYGIYGRTLDVLEMYKITKIDIGLCDDSRAVLSENTTLVEFDGSTRIFDVFFKSPVLLEPFNRYIVYLYKSGPIDIHQHFIGEGGKTVIQESGVTFKLTTSFNLALNYDTAKACIIASLNFQH